MRCWVVWGLLLAGGAAASDQAGVSPGELLNKIRARMAENLTRLPDYVCLQTVERFYRKTKDAAFEPMDTLRLEVGVAEDRELYSWRGARRFEEKELAELVGRGTIGNGNFALHARNIFISGAPRFTPRGEAQFGGRRALRYDYEVPLEDSTYRIRVSPNEAVVPFYGSFWVDAETLDLVRLEVRVDEAPEELGLAEASDIVEYARASIGGSDFLLPRSSELLMVGSPGHASRNRTRFSNCRQYVGEASLSFGGTSVDAPVAREESPQHVLPPNVPLELALDTDIEPENAQLGDAIRALVVRPVKAAEDLLIPEGSAVLGRLVRVEKHNMPIDHYVVALEFHTLELGDTKIPFLATMSQAGPASGLIKQQKRLDPTFTRRRSPKMSILVREQQSGQGILHWEARQPRIRRGLRMRWETQGTQLADK